MEKKYLFAAIILSCVGIALLQPYWQTSDSATMASTNNRNLILGQAKKVNNQTAVKSVVLNDPAMNKNWGLKKTNANRAWNVTQGSKDIVVAIVDTGIDVLHKDLANNLWRNPGETGKDKKGRNKATNGIDDDKNGFIDDVHGWNFVNNDNKLTDNHGHGTHIAGIVGAEGGNNYGITGVAPKVSLMVLKYYDPSAPGNNLLNTIKAFEYATKMNAHIINYSGGGLEHSAKEFQAVKKAREKGILFVAAAGNERSNSDFSKYYPADYELDNIISVTAVNPVDKVLSSSNYGTKTVDIAAPGENIYSTTPGGNFHTMTGTSQATAFVSGVAALIMAHNRDFNAAAVKKYILRTGDSHEWLKSKTGTSKKLNIYRALTSLDQGVAANGVLAANLEGKKTSYSSNINTRSLSSRTGASHLSAFSAQLAETLKKTEKNK